MINRKVQSLPINHQNSIRIDIFFAETLPPSTGEHTSTAVRITWKFVSADKNDNILCNRATTGGKERNRDKSGVLEVIGIFFYDENVEEPVKRDEKC